MRLLKNVSCILLLIICFIDKTWAQKDINNVIRLLKKKKPIEAISNLLGRDNFRLASLQIKRTIDGGHKQLIAEMGEYPDMYEILVQEDERGAYLAVVNNISYKDEQGRSIKEGRQTNKLFKVDSNRLKRFISIHDGIYNSHLNVDSFRTFSINCYGVACGAGGGPTPAFKDMMDLVSMQDTIALLKLIQHRDYELKALGVTGLLILEQKGVYINRDYCQWLDHLKKIRLPLNYCIGCLFQGAQPAEELLDEKWIDFMRSYRLL